jgi:hypothetical protein
MGAHSFLKPQNFNCFAQKSRVAFPQMFFAIQREWHENYLFKYSLSQSFDGKSKDHVGQIVTGCQLLRLAQ